MGNVLWMIFFSPAALAIGGAMALWECWRFWKWFRKSRYRHDVWCVASWPAPRPRERWEGLLEAKNLHIWWTLIYLVVAIALSVLAYVLTPKPKAPQPDSTKDLNDPVAEAGMPIPVVFGTMTVKGLNCLWFGDKRRIRYKIKP